MYRVDGEYPNFGCSKYELKDGQNIEWIYTCDLGEDVGCEWGGRGDRKMKAFGSYNPLTLFLYFFRSFSSLRFCRIPC